MIQLVGMYLVLELWATDILILCLPFVNTLVGIITSFKIGMFFTFFADNYPTTLKLVRQFSDNRFVLNLSPKQKHLYF